jgi:E3 ubiquitin-protein ligase MARCH6
MEEDTCRICRGEATESSPLFYPCKCRGSIKYIHQDCLEEWLKHSNKKEASCDICHQRYKFTTVFQDNTPDRVPIRLIFHKWQQSAHRFFRYAVGVLILTVGCVLQIPLFWAVVSRMLTYTLNNVPVHREFFLSLVYGDDAFSGDPWSYSNLLKTVSQTYMDSIYTLLFAVALNLIFFLLNEKVTTDPGFQKLVEKDIGTVTRKKAMGRDQVRMMFDNLNALQQNLDNIRIDGGQNQRPLAQPLREAGENPEMEQLQRLIQDMRENGNGLADDLLERLERLERQGLNQPQQQEDQEAQELQQEPELAQHNELILDHEDDSEEDPDFVPDDGDSDLDTIHSDEEIEQFERFIERDDLHREDEDEGQRNDDGFQPHTEMLRAARRIAQEGLVNNGEAAREDRLRRLQIVQERQRAMAARFIRQPVVAADPVVRANQPLIDQFPPVVAPIRPFVPPAQARPINRQPRANQAAPADFDQEALILSLPIPMIIVAADLAILLYLLAAYFIPTLIGTSLVHLFFLTSNILSKGGFSLLLKTGLIKYEASFNTMIFSIKNYTPQAVHAFYQSLMTPLVQSLKAIHEQERPLTNIERALILLVFFLALFITVHVSLLGRRRAYQRTKTALSGIERRTYVFFFGVISTLKVFAIFSIELVVFPAFCGALLVFVLAPLYGFETNWLLLRS